LRDAGRVYPAYETAQELDLKRKIAAGRGLPPVYDRAALGLSDAERASFEAAGVKPHWRFKLDHAAPIVWDDLIRGPQKFDAATMSDPAIRRADGSWLYMLPSAIDDMAMDITHVVRGEDHVSNTALQLQMFDAMGVAPPAFAHEALLVGSEGKLSKRLGSLGVAHFREVGIEPEAVRALLARIGTSLPVEPLVETQALVESFDFAKFGRAPARFDEAELAGLNAKIVHQLDFAQVADRLPAGMGAAEWAAVRPNLQTIAEAADWWGVIEGPIVAERDPADADFLAAAARAAESLDWAGDPWHALTAALKAETGRSGKTLFLPLRRALTGREHGPDMKALLPLIGRDRAIARLSPA
jgi:glutamyl-tRNA synthetase